MHPVQGKKLLSHSKQARFFNFNSNLCQLLKQLIITVHDTDILFCSTRSRSADTTCRKSSNADTITDRKSRNEDTEKCQNVEEAVHAFRKRMECMSKNHLVGWRWNRRDVTVGLGERWQPNQLTTPTSLITKISKVLLLNESVLQRFQYKIYVRQYWRSLNCSNLLRLYITHFCRITTKHDGFNVGLKKQKTTLTLVNTL